MRPFAPIVLCALVLAATGAPRLPAQDVRAALTLEPDRLGLDERAMLRIKIEGAGARIEPEPDFRLENFRVAAGPTLSSSVTFSGRGSTANATLTWLLEPLAVGPARVHSASVRIDGRVLELAERRVEVLAEAPPERRDRRAADPRLLVRSRSPSANHPSYLGPADEPRTRRRRPARRSVVPQVFLRAEAVPASPWVGEQVLYTLYLYTEADVGSIRPEELPDFKGFWSRTIPQSGLIPEPVDGDLYRVVLLEQALFPRRGGRFEIPPVAATMEARVRDPGITGSLMPRTHELSRVSNPVAVEVRELPPAPAGFRGAVGRIDLAAELAPRELEAGEAATLTVTVRGRGHLQGIPAPELPALAGVEVFPPQQQGDETLTGKEVSGLRAWSYVLVPERPGEWRLPAIEVTYFDPREERYRVARGPELELVARGSTRRAKEGGRAVDLHPIRTAALPAVAGDGVDWARLRPWLFAIPWGLGLLLLLVRRRRGDGGRARARDQLVSRLAAAAGESLPRRAAAEIEEAWRDFLEDRWGIPRGVPSPRWGQLLIDRGADPARAGELVRLAEDLHYLRYAPKLAAAEELRRDLRDRLRRLARRLR